MGSLTGSSKNLEMTSLGLHSMEFHVDRTEHVNIDGLFDGM